MIGLQLN